MYPRNLSPEEVQRRATEQARQKAAERAEADRKRRMEDELLDIERRRDKREKQTLIVAWLALFFSTLSILLSLAQWISGLS